MKAFTRSLYTLSIANGFATGIPMATYGAFLLSLGLSAFQVNIVNIAFYILVVLLEIPTGALSDKYGRKVSEIIYLGLYTVGTMTYAFAHNLPSAMIAESILDVGATFHSGSFSSWAEDSLKNNGVPSDQRHKIRTSADTARRAASIAGGVLGGLIAYWYSYHAVYVASAIAIALSIIITKYVMVETVNQSSHQAHDSLANIIRTGFSLCKSSAMIRTIMISSAIYCAGTQAINMQWQHVLGLSPWQQGMMYTAIHLSIITGGLLAKRISLNERAQTLWSALSGVPIIIGIVVGQPLLPIMFLLHEFARGVWGPIRLSRLHNSITAEMPRATILSFESMIWFGGGVLGLVISGILAEYSSYSVAWFVSGLIFMMQYIYSLITKSRD
jgi:MFS family permease